MGIGTRPMCLFSVTLLLFCISCVYFCHSELICIKRTWSEFDSLIKYTESSFQGRMGLTEDDPWYAVGEVVEYILQGNISLLKELGWRQC